jgi:hypothetical protein
MIIYPLVFSWKIDGGRVHFSVSENKAHTIHQKYYSFGKIPPINERVEYMKNLGLYSGSDIKNVVRNHIQWGKNAVKNQEALDKIFLKFNVKPTKKKVLKSVKKL